MQIEIYNNRKCLFDSSLEGVSALEGFKIAVANGIIPENSKIFYGSSRTFGVLEGNVFRTYKMRDNWNGWHDLGAYQLPDWQEIGTKTYADPSAGRHRDVISL